MAANGTIKVGNDLINLSTVAHITDCTERDAATGKCADGAVVTAKIFFASPARPAITVTGDDAEALLEHAGSGATDLSAHSKAKKPAHAGHAGK